MEPLEFGDPPEDALVLIDSAPIIYFLEGHPKFGPRFKPISHAFTRCVYNFLSARRVVSKIVREACRMSWFRSPMDQLRVRHCEEPAGRGGNLRPTRRDCCAALAMTNPF